MSTTESMGRRWRLRPRAAIGGGVALLLLAGFSVGAVEDVGTHRALGSAQSSLVSTRRDLTAASAAASSLSAQLAVLGSAQASMRAQDARLASENASLAAQLSAAASAQAAQAGAPIFARSGSGGIPEPAAIGVVISSSGPYVVRYTFTGCSNDSPIAFTLLNGATNEFVHLAPNASGNLIGVNDAYLAAGNWFLFGGAQLVSTGGYDSHCKWTLAIAHTG
jgi:hypothetical protein